MIPWRAKADAKAGSTPRSVNDGFEAGEVGITNTTLIRDEFACLEWRQLAAIDQDSLVSSKAPSHRLMTLLRYAKIC